MARRARGAGLEVVPATAGSEHAVVLAVATRGLGSRPLSVPSIAPAVRQADAVGTADVTVAGFWGGLGSLLAAVAIAEADQPSEVHVAYGFPGARGC